MDAALLYVLVITVAMMGVWLAFCEWILEPALTEYVNGWLRSKGYPVDERQFREDGRP